ncbi:MAG: DNRLRE domain-containing protein [Candidatus Aenigmarchaeota archaeon]|nr:DNRLRE domain-containing protein [Candidatus Aenigmarchaeota archaeon]
MIVSCWLLVILIASTAILISPLALAQATVAITSAEDNTIDGTPGTEMAWNRGGYATFSVGDKFGGDKPQRALVRFDLSAIPTGPTIRIDSAMMELTCISTNDATDFILSAYRLLKPWSEGASTGFITDVSSSWNYWNYSSRWGMPGASSASSSGTDNTGNATGPDRGASAIGFANVSNCSNSVYIWNITTAVKNWISGAWQNNGLIIISSGEGTSANGKHFASAEESNAALRPRLVAAYTCIPSPEVCNGIDDDCNGIADDGVPPRAGTCGIGACFSSVNQTCSSGQYTPSCVPGSPGTEACNGVDDDCDGTVDEDTPVNMTSCGMGACFRSVNQTCTAGSYPACTPGSPGTEACNNMDDDCDGDVDEDLATAATCGIGLCSRTVSQACSGGSYQPACVPGSPLEERCNGIDDSCDGAIDDGNVCAACADNDADGFAGTAAACHLGEDCNDGNAGINPGMAETCNGIDDNCNGLADEWGICGPSCIDNDGDGHGAGCPAGLDCNDGNAAIHSGAAEVCNSADDDCDGGIDEDDVCTTPPVRYIISTSYYDGATTNFSGLATFSQVTDILLEKVGKGRMEFTAPITFRRDLNLDTHSIISGNLARINSLNMPEFNLPTRITLTGLAFSNPRVLKDGAPCDPAICAIQSYSGGALVFTVTGFSEYSAQETGPVCGNGACEAGESCSSCSQDCGSCSSGEGGGGGGGGSCTPSPELCDGRDNDCDGIMDDNCVTPCTEGSTRACGITQAIGICSPGISTCTNGIWSICQGEVTPERFDVCGDGLDNDCNGAPDDGCETAAATCTNGIQDGSEEGVDCGGICADKCNASNSPGTVQTPLGFPVGVEYLFIAAGILLIIAMVIAYRKTGGPRNHGMSRPDLARISKENTRKSD